MTAFVLVTYTTRYGSTQEVAEAIAATLRDHGLEVEVQPASEIRTLEGYGTVVLGAALYTGQWHRDARSFLKRHHKALSERPIAIFALGPLSSAEKEWQGSREQLDRALAKFPWLAPVAVELFGGVINPAKLHFPFNHMPAGDARDWTVIHAWADKLAATFQRPVPPVSAQAQAVQ
jgi:menaquinone-dependent protoporphyrinogen oxidase